MMDKNILPAKPSANLDDAGPIVHHPMGLPAATEPGLEPGSLVAQLTLRCSVLAHCTSREAHYFSCC